MKARRRDCTPFEDRLPTEREFNYAMLCIVKLMTCGLLTSADWKRLGEARKVLEYFSRERPHLFKVLAKA